MGRGGGLVVSALAFYTDDPSLNAGYLNFMYKKTKIYQKRPGLAHLKKIHSLHNSNSLLDKKLFG